MISRILIPLIWKKWLSVVEERIVMEQMLDPNHERVKAHLQKWRKRKKNGVHLERQGKQESKMPMLKVTRKQNLVVMTKTLILVKKMQVPPNDHQTKKVQPAVFLENWKWIRICYPRVVEELRRLHCQHLRGGRMLWRIFVDAVRNSKNSASH